MTSFGQGRSLDGARAVALAPAAAAFTLLVVMVQVRMDEPWADGVLLLVALVAAVPLLALALAAPREARAERTILVVCALVLAGLTIGRLGNTLAGDDYLDGGGALTWMLALFTALSAFVYTRTRAVVAVLITALAAVALVLEFVNWAFGAEDVDVFRVLLALAFAGLFAAGVMVTGRVGTLLVAAAGFAALVGYYATGLAFLFAGPSGGLGWGWELITLVEGVALAVYAATRLEPGPAYLAFFVLVLFAGTAAISGDGTGGGLIVDGDEIAAPEDGPSLLGWPLVLAVATVAAGAWGLRRGRDQIAATS
jgi:hypothetical protein